MLHMMHKPIILYCVPLASSVRDIWLDFLDTSLLYAAPWDHPHLASLLLYSRRPQLISGRAYLHRYRSLATLWWNISALFSFNFAHTVLLRKGDCQQDWWLPNPYLVAAHAHVVYVIIHIDLHLLSLSVINLEANILVRFSSSYGQWSFFQKSFAQKI